MATRLLGSLKLRPFSFKAFLCFETIENLHKVENVNKDLENKDLFVFESFENKLMTRHHIIPSLWVRGGEIPPETAGGWRPGAQPGGPAAQGRVQEE